MKLTKFILLTSIIIIFSILAVQNVQAFDPTVADFTYVIQGTTVYFTSTSTCDPMGMLNNVITSYSWDFGDGTTSSDMNPVHAYSTASSYTITLTVEDAMGATDDIEKSVYAYNPRSSNVTTNTIVPLSGSYYNKTVQDIFGNGSFANMSIDDFIGDIIAIFVAVYGPFFWAGVFGIIALVLFERQENAVIPALLTMIGGVPIILWELPLDWQKGIGIMVTLVIAGLLYALKRKR
jgi:hypothetical protein